MGQKSIYELETTVDYKNLAFSFLKISLLVYAVDIAQRHNTGIERVYHSRYMAKQTYQKLE